MTLKKEIFGWSVYDLANTAFSALFITFFFPLLIKVYLGGNEFQIGLVSGISMFLAGMFVPFVGALSDITGRRMKYIIFFTLICVTFTALTAYMPLYLALIFALIAMLSYHTALDVYDAKLVDISTSKNRGKISGYGVALGYVGAILSLGMAYAILSIYGWNSLAGIKAIFPATALFFLSFSLITFTLVKDRTKKNGTSLGKNLKKAFLQIKDTIKKLPRYEGVLPFLIASFLYTDGMNTVILFLYLYAREQIKLPLINFLYFYALFALAAIIGSLIFGKISDRIKPKKTLMLLLIIWAFIILLLIRVSNLATFIIAGCMGGVALGAVWTVTRPMLVKLSPKNKIAQLFGFQGMTEKFSGVLGPIIFGFIVVRASYQAALIVLLSFFALGFIFLMFVPNKS
ncbi:MFS transporter [Candidatus Woesearchaeota archaeon]|nr:MFS transporter [Candidatus Woesearchaeota archaeon]